MRTSLQLLKGIAVVMRDVVMNDVERVGDAKSFG
jgi:hypothetical protein